MAFQHSPKLVTNGLQLCLDAKNPKSYPGSGTTWYDISGNGYNFTWNTVSWDSSGFFNTSGRQATGPASNSFGIDNSSGYTIFLIFQTNNGSTNSAFKFYSSTGSGSGNRAIFLHPGWTNDTLYFDQGGCCNADQRITYYNADVIGSGVWLIVGLRSTVATRSILYNGSLVTNTTTTAANINIGSSSVVLNPSDESYNWDGKLAYFSVYNRGLSDSEYVNNYEALKSRFGL